MNIPNAKKWQFAAGDKKRNYVDLLLKWDVIALGPGDYGAWPDSKIDIQKNAPGQIRILDRFFNKTKKGDLIILRLGTDEVYGVGIVEEDSYYWYDDFGDIDGWDLQFVRRVRWLWKYENKICCNGSQKRRSKRGGFSYSNGL
jgi:hypothetical protein